MMHRAWGAICAATIAVPGAISPACGETLDARWQAVGNIEARHFSWSSSRPYPGSASASPSRGHQFYLPLALQLAGRPNELFQVEFLLRSAYVNSRQQAGALTGVYSGPTDTTFSTTLTYYGLNGIQPFVSLNLRA
jgi:hypothetical protein